MNKIYFTLLIALTTSWLFSQTGPGGVGTSNINVLWLKADAGTSSTVTGTPISAWNDQSGNGINVTQTVAIQQPSFATNVMNGMPAIEFDNIETTNDRLIAPDNSKLDNTPGLSMFTVSNVNKAIPVANEARTIISKRNNVSAQESYMLFYYSGNKVNLDVEHSTSNRFSSVGSFSLNTNYIINFLYDGALPAAQRVNLYFGETLDKTATESSSAILDNNSPLNIGTTNEGDKRPFGGYISEVIIYTVTVNAAQRIIINNYLSSKYDIALTTNDKYAGDTPANGNYDRAVAGIGAESSGANTTFSASATQGFGINALSGLDAGDYILSGHAVAKNSLNLSDTSGLSGANSARWERVWYVDVTNSMDTIKTNIEFDMVAGEMSGVTPANASNYKLLYRPSSTGKWTVVSTASSVSGSRITFNGCHFYSNDNDGYYTIGTTNNAVSPLPIELLTFDAQLNNKQVDVNWATASETDNDYFTVEKSKDGIIFENIANIKADGNSLTYRQYQYTDDNPYENISYYRLKQTDYNKTFTYSKIVAVNHVAFKNSITIFPNPNTGNFNVSFNELKEQQVKIIVKDINGRDCFTKEVDDIENINTINIDTNGALAKGIYMIMIISNDDIYSQKIIVN